LRLWGLSPDGFRGFLGLSACIRFCIVDLHADRRRDRRTLEGSRPDIIVDGKLVIEVKVVAALLPLHKQQLTTYMR